MLPIAGDERSSCESEVAWLETTSSVNLSSGCMRPLVALAVGVLAAWIRTGFNDVVVTSDNDLECPLRFFASSAVTVTLSFECCPVKDFDLVIEFERALKSRNLRLIDAPRPFLFKAMLGIDVPSASS